MRHIFAGIDATPVVITGIGLLIAAGTYAALLLQANSLPPKLRPPAPAGLRGRVRLAVAVAVVVPALSVAALFVVGATGPGAGLIRFALAVSLLFASLAVVVVLVAALCRSITGPLSALDLALSRFDPELDCSPPAVPDDAPRELVAIFSQLAAATGRVHKSYGQLRQSLRQGERLRNELYQVIQERELEIEQRTVELRQARATLDRLTREDELTGTANRRTFAEFLDRAWRLALREQQPLSMLMVDIDYFRAYNDAYGHAKGDTCIRAVTDAIRHIVGRASDLVSRYGGEEFVVVLGNTPLEGALQVAEQIRGAVESLAIPQHPALAPTVVTVSVGVTSTVPTRGAQPETFLVAADRALHAAKEQGRNQVGYSAAGRTGLFQSLCLPNTAERRLF